MGTEKITGVTRAWFSDNYFGPEEAANATPDQVVRSVAYSNAEMGDLGWTLIGPATITIEIPEPKELILNKIASLRATIQKTRADAEVACGRMHQQIAKLEALDWDGESFE